MSLSLRTASSATLAVLLCAGSSACVDISAGNVRYVDTVEKRFTVSGPPALSLGTFDGSVDVSTWDRPEVLVVVEKHAVDKETADRMVVEATQDGDRITVNVRDQRDGGLHITVGSFSAQVKVTMPAKATVEANTGDGRVSIRDIQGDLTVRTGDGSIRLMNVTGAVDANSGDGSIDIDGAITGLKARSGDGRVRILAKGPGPASDWVVATGDGSVLLEVPETFGAELDAATGDGRVSIHGLPFSREGADSERMQARGRLGNGGASIKLRSGDGTITVRNAEAPLEP